MVLVCFFFINSIADDVLPTLDTYVDSDFPTQSFSNDSALKLVDNRLSQQARYDPFDDQIFIFGCRCAFLSFYLKKKNYVFLNQIDFNFLDFQIA